MGQHASRSGGVCLHAKPNGNLMDLKILLENLKHCGRGRGQETKQRPRIGEPRRSFISIHTQPPIARPLAAPYVNMLAV